MSLTWNDLFLTGSVVDLTFQSWTGRAGIKPADLGIPDSDEVDRALALGTHRLIPREAFERMNELARKAKRTVDYYSLPFGFVPGARYVPDANMPELSLKLRGYKADFDAAAEAFINEYDALKAAMLPVLTKALQDAAQSTLTQTKDEVVTQALGRLMVAYPPAEVVRTKFRLTWTVFAIQGPRTSAAAAALQEEGDTVRSAVAEMASKLRGEVKEKLAEVLSLVQKGGKLGERSVEGAMKVLDHVDAVNILGDELLKQQVGKLRDALRGIQLNELIPDATVTGLQDIKVALEADIETAVRDAEERLTGLGRRKLMVA